VARAITNSGGDGVILDVTGRDYDNQSWAPLFRAFRHLAIDDRQRRRCGFVLELPHLGVEGVDLFSTPVH
jgi:hypothetical protein